MSEDKGRLAEALSALADESADRERKLRELAENLATNGDQPEADKRSPEELRAAAMADTLAKLESEQWHGANREGE